MIQGLVKRLEALEAVYKYEPLIVLAETESGEEVTLPMLEFLADYGSLRFVRVLSGKNMKELDLFLQAIREEAFKEGNGKEQ